jgi:hypothetical protein
MSDTEIEGAMLKINLNSMKENIKQKIYNDGQEYKILNYDKNYLSYNDFEAFKCRSVILAHPENIILSFSSPKSISYTEFTKENKMSDSIYVNEYIEGTMLNLFYDIRVNRWILSTKSAIGANYFYYRNNYGNTKKSKQKTFYQMFIEAFRMDNNTDISDIFLINELPKTYSYSFVLQHPDNHIVLDIKEPKVYLVAVYEIVGRNTVKAVPIHEVERWSCFSSGIVLFPRHVENDTYDNLYNMNTSIQNKPDFVGIMITNLNTGYRTKIENPIYYQKKVLRGNNPNLQYQYLCLSRIKKVDEFLRFFPRYGKLFKKFSYDYTEFIKNIHLSYLHHYVQKKDIKISEQYYKHIYNIHHNIYIPSLNIEAPRIIKRNVVKEYFDKMEPRELLYHLNFNLRS